MSEDNPPGVYAGLPGPASAYKNLGKTKQVPMEQVKKDLIDLLKSMPMSDEDIEAFYNAIVGRSRHKVCATCGKLRSTLGGSQRYHHSGDLSKPKSFVCEGCSQK